MVVPPNETPPVLGGVVMQSRRLWHSLPRQLFAAGLLGNARHGAAHAKDAGTVVARQAALVLRVLGASPLLTPATKAWPSGDRFGTAAVGHHAADLQVDHTVGPAPLGELILVDLWVAVDRLTATVGQAGGFVAAQAGSSLQVCQPRCASVIKQPDSGTHSPLAGSTAKTVFRRPAADTAPRRTSRRRRTAPSSRRGRSPIGTLEQAK